MSHRTTVTAKVQCTSRTVGHNGSVALSFGPDYANGRNAEWAEATPHLSLSTTVNAAVGKHFELHGKYTLTFEPSDE